MRKHLYILLLFLALGIVAQPVIFGTDQAAAAVNQTVISEDPQTGRIIVENDFIKGVWHYKTLASLNHNQGGGSIYELYYKPKDPGATSNLVSFANFTGWGNGRSTAIWSGVGGVGSTTLYAVDSPPPSGATNGFNDVLGENNQGGTLESYSTNVDALGNAVLTFSYRVHNQSTGKTWYRVIKKWIVEPGGAIRLEMDWQIISSGYFAEPGLRTNWSRNTGWNRFVKYGRDWLSPGQAKYFLGSTDIESLDCWDTLNRFTPDWIAYAGPSTSPVMVMSSDYDNGFTDSGSYRMGEQTWGSPASPTEEQCSIPDPMPNRNIGSYTVFWTASWGGNPPEGSRYRRIESGTTWSDKYRIELRDSLPGGPIDISNVQARATGSGTARVTWDASTETDAAVEVSTSPDNPGSWRTIATSSLRTRQQSIDISGLTPGANYSFRVRGRDANGVAAVSSGYTFQATTPAVMLNVNSAQGAYWRSYGEYLSGQLAVDFNLGNVGTIDANNVQITGVMNTNGVHVRSGLPLSVSNIPPGDSARVTVVYEVPAGIQSFVTRMQGSAQGADGDIVSFP